MLGIIGGTALLQARLPPLEKIRVSTPFGPVLAHVGRIVFISRHQHNTPPHRINHRAHLAAMKILGVDRLIIFGSTGSMHDNLLPGSIVIPDDYFSPWDIPTLHDNDIGHTPPSIDAALREELAQIIPEGKTGTYFQTRGPRFETQAEIAFFAKKTDVVGMTAASELTLANELDIPAAALCTVDNYANGIGGSSAPDYDEIVSISKQNGDRITAIITKIVEKLA
ncbi:MAG: MTAP family purine nucleoside phosphorylase [Methanocorpusculum sp.]|jgi:5'-methylthioadenosine phosphorylase|nr:MTAP family purine nucleoside phosphorylase [Methanocorpusculum sp.]MDD4423098.1 MTAP family purine nucleoside phosphorylase [Methanocorpusculum parvum]MDD2802689.1 MTAP family purine nucleoside phosphorylase [Methanocorpusculum sp.]MDD3046556.1 MTAP family purine nucleoside phosphorylase [Methanocorpusculum sp.]MDD3911941.1 MTAP family purine nucleoside phosphorylase [Methanocorpusculum sp.]